LYARNKCISVQPSSTCISLTDLLHSCHKDASTLNFVGT